MSAGVLHFPTRRVRAKAVADAVRHVALRLGYHPHNADCAAAIARKDFLSGRYSAARAVTEMVDQLGAAMRQIRVKGGAA